MTAYHLSLSVFMTHRTTSGLKKFRKSTNPGSYQRPKIFSSSLNRLKIAQDGFTHFTPGSAPAYRFIATFKKSHKVL